MWPLRAGRARWDKGISVVCCCGLVEVWVMIIVVVSGFLSCSMVVFLLLVCECVYVCASVSVFFLTLNITNHVNDLF